MRFWIDGRFWRVGRFLSDWLFRQNIRWWSGRYRRRWGLFVEAQADVVDLLLVDFEEFEGVGWEVTAAGAGNFDDESVFAQWLEGAGVAAVAFVFCAGVEELVALDAHERFDGLEDELIHG